MPTEVVKTVGTAGDYTTWALWEADTDNDLVTADQVQVGNQVNESLTTPSITMVGATTDATRYREMRGQGFDGLGGGAVLNMTTGILTISEANFRCTTLNIAHSGSGTMAISITTSAGILVDRCIIYDANATTGRTYQILIDSSASATIRRCVIIGWNRGVLINTGTTGVIQNCTAIGRAPTVAVGTPSIGVTNSGTGTLENCVVMGFHDARDISAGWTTIQYNASGDGTSTGTGALVGQTGTMMRFRNLAQYDYSCRSSSTLAGSGVDLSAQFTTDITGRTITSWPIGAHQPVLAPTFGGRSEEHT